MGSVQPGLPLGLTIGKLTFQRGAFNADAYQTLSTWLETSADRGVTAMALTGLDRAGKTSLAADLAQHYGGAVATADPDGQIPVTPMESPFVVIDDTHLAEPMGLLARFNKHVGAGQKLLLVGRGRPEKWGSGGDAPQPIDLRSRLGGLPTVTVDAPDAHAVTTAVMALLSDAGVRLRRSDVEAVVTDSVRRRFEAATALATAVLVRILDDGPDGKGLLKEAVADIPTYQL